MHSRDTMHRWLRMHGCTPLPCQITWETHLNIHSAYRHTNKCTYPFLELKPDSWVSAVSYLEAWYLRDEHPNVMSLCQCSTICGNARVEAKGIAENGTLRGEHSACNQRHSLNQKEGTTISHDDPFTPLTYNYKEESACWSCLHDDGIMALL